MSATAILPSFEPRPMQVEEMSEEELAVLMDHRRLPLFNTEPTAQSREEFLIDHQFEIYPTLERYNEFFVSRMSLQRPNETTHLENFDLLINMASSNRIIDFKGLKLSPRTIVRQEKIQDSFRFWPREGINKTNQDALIRHLQMGYMLNFARSRQHPPAKTPSRITVFKQKHQQEYEKAKADMEAQKKEAEEYANAKPVSDADLDALLGF